MHLNREGTGTKNKKKELTNRNNGNCQKWLLYRIDDNGNTFEMDYYVDRISAEKAKSSYESKQHKQSYYVREVT